MPEKILPESVVSRFTRRNLQALRLGQIKMDSDRIKVLKQTQRATDPEVLALLKRIADSLKELGEEKPE